MSGWEDLVGKSEPKPATILDEKPKESVIAKRSIDDRISDSVKENENVWKLLGFIDAYNTGRMFGRCDGPDNVSVKDLLDKFSSMIVETIKVAYIKCGKSFNRELLDMFSMASKAVATMETQEVFVARPKLLAALHGFSDSYVQSADPESVKNMSLATL